MSLIVSFLQRLTVKAGELGAGAFGGASRSPNYSETKPVIRKLRNMTRKLRTCFGDSG